jgi:catechol 2,3-dioxygenase-like lactoylglutathione lyase family enzyme
MRVETIDHVNIRSPDVVGTSHFFAAILDMQVSAAPGMNDATIATWVHDVDGRAVIHVSGPGVIYGFEPETVMAPPGSGRVHHVALRCTGYDEFINRLREKGFCYHTNEVSQAGLRQIFITDPNDILLELNFFEVLTNISPSG